jgi:hypothetical protein
VARLEEHREFPHALLSGLRVTFQPAALIQFGYTNASKLAFIQLCGIAHRIDEAFEQFARHFYQVGVL